MSEETLRNFTLVAATGEAELELGRFIVVVIGIDDYHAWPKLHNAVSDALGVEELFTQKLGFLNPIPPLLNGAATEDTILALIQDQLPPLLQPSDNLLLFFAGHGHTRVTKVGDKEIETGYIVPVDAQLNRWSDYIKISTLLEEIGQLPARHILVVLDSCHSGFALGDAMARHRSAVRYERDLVRRLSRKVITSARRDQPAVDSGPLPGHSLFTGTIIDGFNWGKVDLDGNGLITAFELGLFLQQQVGQASNAIQTPDFGSFYLDDRGEMVISLADDNFDALKARAFTALRYRDLATFAQLVTQLAVLKPQSPEVLYLQFRLHFHANQIDAALDKIFALRSLPLAPGAIPLSDQDLLDLSVQLPFWQALLGLPHTAMPVELAMLHGPTATELTALPPQLTPDGILYRVTGRTVGRYQVRNQSASPAHLYWIGIHYNGTLRIGPLLESANEIFTGLAPDHESYSHPFAISQPPGIYESRIFYAPERIDWLVAPPNTATRAIMHFDAPLDAVRMVRVLHEVVVPTPTEVDTKENKEPHP